MIKILFQFCIVAGVCIPALLSGLTVEGGTNDSPDQLLRDLLIKQSSIGGFRAVLIRTDSSGNRSASHVAFDVTNSRMYVGAPKLVVSRARRWLGSPSLFYDGEKYWEEIGTLLVEFQTPVNPSELTVFQRLSDSTNLPMAAVSVSNSNGWIIVERKFKLSAQMQQALQDAPIPAKVADQAARYGITTEEILATLRRGISLAESETHRYWYDKHKGLCVRWETIDANAQIVSKNELQEVEYGVKFEEGVFRPNTQGKRVVQATTPHDPEIERLKAEALINAPVPPVIIPPQTLIASGVEAFVQLLNDRWQKQDRRGCAQLLKAQLFASPEFVPVLMAAAIQAAIINGSEKESEPILQKLEDMIKREPLPSYPVYRAELRAVVKQLNGLPPDKPREAELSKMFADGYPLHRLIIVAGEEIQRSEDQKLIQPDGMKGK